MPPDRVFGRTETELKTMDTIVTLEMHYNVFLKYGTVFKISEDFDVYDWKSAMEQVVKKKQISDTFDSR